MISFADWNMTPMPLLPENDLPTADIVQWFSISLPGHHLSPPRSLVRVLWETPHAWIFTGPVSPLYLWLRWLTQLVEWRMLVTGYSLARNLESWNKSWVNWWRFLWFHTVIWPGNGSAIISRIIALPANGGSSITWHSPCILCVWTLSMMLMA